MDLLMLKLSESDASTGMNTPDTSNDAKSDKISSSNNGKEDGTGEGDKDEKKVVVGVVSEAKDLYAKYDEDGNRSWSEKKPTDLEEAAENEETRKYAVIVRKKKPKEADSTRPLVVDSIIIQSPYLKRALAKVLDGYPGIVTNVSRLTLSAPFECFVHRWDRFAAARDHPDNDELTREHMVLLCKIMEEELGDIIQLRQDYFKNKAVTFEHAWALFPPGCTIWGYKSGKPIAARFERGYYAETMCGKAYFLKCEHVNWNGTMTGWQGTTLQISEFLGARPFTDLSAFPIDYHSRPEAAKAMLLGRGRKFESMIGYHYKYYNGTAIYHPEVDRSKTRPEVVQSRVVIDSRNYERCNPDHQMYLSTIRKHDDTLRKRRDSWASDDSADDSDDDQSDHLAIDDDSNDKPAPLTKDQLMMTSPIVRGYAMKNKRWMEFFVDDFSEISFDEKAFDSLVMQEDQKDMILAFAQSQVKFKTSFDDFISGKGKGIIMLLSGGPGIGKTLTAESVAEEMRVPLYIMSAGDLGTDADEVESNLEDILRMVANWDAVLLLDECDVFLEERSPHDMERNRIVSIFLRMLEYYEGILFLTTNRIKNMDPAFESRIHISLDYPPLDRDARFAVWRTFLDRATISLEANVKGMAAHVVTAEEVEMLAGLTLNGRQIKNVLKTGNLLACHKEEKLGFKHLQTVLRVQGHSL